MSMNMLTLLQLTGIFCAYLLVTLGLPAFVLERRLKEGHRLTERFLIYFMLGNFYIMNLVFILQLLKISNFFTLVMGTIVPALWAWVVVNKIPVREDFRELAKIMRRVSMGLMGWKTLTLRIWTMGKRRLALLWQMAGRFLFRRTIDTLLTFLLLAALVWLYGGNIFQQYGYKASDLLVHNYWINAMNDNQIFVAGVYPHGFHCVVYYLHEVFGFDTYVILRVFAFPQNVMIHLMLLGFLKLCCKSRYAAYIGTFLYTIGGVFVESTYSRYDATLPQEFGMLFILPAVYFGFAYFASRREELAEEAQNSLPEAGEARKKKVYKSRIYLAEFAMSFAMTLAVHFYGTMIAGLFCAAMALGYGFLFFRKKYFREVVITCAISVGIAVLPMLLAFLGGTPLQGSLGWGWNVITGGNNNTVENSAGSTAQDAPDQGAETTQGELPGAQSETVEGTVPGAQPEATQGGAQGAQSETVEGTVPGAQSETTQGGVPGAHSEMVEGNVPGAQPEATQGGAPGAAVGTGESERSISKPLVKGMGERLKNGWQAIYRAINASVLRLSERERAYWIMYSFFALIGLGVVFFLLRQNCYGAMMISAGIYMLFISVMMAARAFGLPPLMDNNRGSIYFAYSLAIVASFLADAILVLCCLPVKRKTVINILSLLCLALTIGYLWQIDGIKKPGHTPAQIMNENIVCLTNIIKGEKDYSWTIVSANDETQMGADHGYHYETIVFLEEMEGVESDDMIRIPTEKVYFFIEKYPVDYSMQYAESGQSISEEGAARPLPANNGIRMYQGEKRWIVMSRMYYWAKEFQRLYPNEMDVYFETDRFICYRIEQNPYRYYNFAIDYGFNAQVED